ncbi:MAG: acyltransferase family protein [Gammaproteobacteria bacterium]
MLKSSLASLRMPGQIKSLDGLRAIAILLVLVTHTCQRIPGLSFVYWNTEWATPIYNGWMGVDLFFVLSGFLIGSIIIKNLNNNTFSIISFYRHRFFRILPAYFFMILFVVCIKSWLPQQYNGFLPDINY